MEVTKTKEELSRIISPFREAQNLVGFVPTMGALHEGHLSLIQQGLEDNAVVVVSIFVNPTQFDNSEDLQKYPRTLERDVALLKTLSDTAIVVFAPSVDVMYGTDVQAQTFDFGGIEFEMEGAFREGHFDGVGTIVKRLFELVEPDNAYFGEKDFQQLQIVKKLAEICNLPVNVIGCPIHREHNGLAMSSRNERLKPEYKMAAPFIYQTLKTAKAQFGTKSAKIIAEWVSQQFAKHQLLELEYFMIADVETLKPVKRKSKLKQYRAFIAVYADNIRLIDNIALN